MSKVTETSLLRESQLSVADSPNKVLTHKMKQGLLVTQAIECKIYICNAVQSSTNSKRTL